MINVNYVSNEKIELYEKDGRYFLRLDFDYEDNYGYYKGHIERIEFDFRLKSVEQETDWSVLRGRNVCFIDLGLNTRLPILLDEEKHYYTLTLVKEKVHDMTIEEIEKKLGYKIRVVAKSK